MRVLIFIPGLNYPGKRDAALSSAEDHKLLANSSPENASGAPDELPIELEESQPPQKIPKLALKTHMVAQEVRVRVTGAHPGKSAVAGRELFDEETTSILISENGGVITLRAAVAPGQLLFLENVESKREVVGQVIRKRAHRPTSCYVELEFTEPARGFWGMEFSAATALLPKDAAQREAAEMVTSAEATDDEPEQRAAAPAAEEVQALKREVEALRQQLKQMQPASVSTTPVLESEPPPLAVASDATAPRLDLALPVPPAAPPEATRTVEIPRSAVYAPVAPPPADYVPIAEEAAREQVAPERVRVYEPAADLAVPSPKVKRFRRPTGNFTPGFRAGALRFGLFAGALVLTIVGAASYQHWSPWGSTAKSAPIPPTPEALTAKVSALSAKPQTDSALEQANKTAPANESLRTPPVVSSQSAAPVDSRKPEPVEVAPPGPAFTTGVAAGRTHTGRTPPSATLTAKRAAELPQAEAFADATVHAAANDGFVPPTLIHSVRPVASLHQLYDFETGHVVIDAVVDTAGDVIATQPIAGPPSLRGPAAAAVMQFRYQPATRKGRPVATHIRVIVPFEYEP